MQFRKYYTQFCLALAVSWIVWWAVTKVFFPPETGLVYRVPGLALISVLLFGTGCFGLFLSFKGRVSYWLAIGVFLNPFAHIVAWSLPTPYEFFLAGGALLGPISYSLWELYTLESKL